MDNRKTTLKTPRNPLIFIPLIINDLDIILKYLHKSLIFNEKFFYIFTLKLGILNYFTYLYYVIKNEIYEFTFQP